MQNSSKKIALITGANKGIGFAVARQLGQAGCFVLIGARNPALGQEAAAKLQQENLDVRFIEIDLGRRETIRTAAAAIDKDFQRLDILVNNAAIAVQGGDGPPSSAKVEVVQSTMQTNFLGTLEVTQAMLPLVRKSLAGRIVNVSSDLGSLAKQGDRSWKYAPVKLIGYSASKAALNMLTVQLAYELRETAIKVNSVNPGYTATDLNHHSGTQTVEEGSVEIVRLSLLGADGPTGSYSEKEGPLAW
jgi:NAD(P)-dependent dehydrogenase (short-subunit alcohol dehydrogenase family)